MSDRDTLRARLLATIERARRLGSHPWQAAREGGAAEAVRERGGAPEPDLLVGLRRFIDGKRIEAALPPGLKGRGLVLDGVETLGGLTNRNYKLRVDGQTLVLRLPGRGTGRFIDRSTERANQEAAARAGFTPPSIFFNGRTGVKVTPYLSEARALDPTSAAEGRTLEGVARLLARFHGSGIRFVNDFDVFRLARTYERVALTRLARFYEGFAGVRSRVFAIEAPLAAGSGKRVACHNDLVPENILEVPDGFLLIDWEYSGMNDPCWDLASFSLESGFDEERELVFLAAYGRAPVSGSLRARVEAYKVLQDYLWSLWSLMQETANRDPAKARSYRDYGLDRYSRLRARLPRVEALFGLSRRENDRERQRR